MVQWSKRRVKRVVYCGPCDDERLGTERSAEVCAAHGGGGEGAMQGGLSPNHVRVPALTP